jgi:hypothetical protein
MDRQTSAPHTSAASRSPSDPQPAAPLSLAAPLTGAAVEPRDFGPAAGWWCQEYTRIEPRITPEADAAYEQRATRRAEAMREIALLRRYIDSTSDHTDDDHVEAVGAAADGRHLHDGAEPPARGAVHVGEPRAIHYDSTNGPDNDSFTFSLDERAVPSTYLPRFGVDDESSDDESVPSTSSCPYDDID